MTMQFTRMVMVMVPSKRGCFVNHVARRLSGLDGVKRKREVGPWSKMASFCFRTIL
jgi:hypothetical protein